MYPALTFTCAFTSAFHTSEQNYSNLYPCAPYILGTTLRGATWRALIDTDCSGNQLQEMLRARLEPDYSVPLLQKTPTFHDQCDNDSCRLKPLFSLPTRFSFGTFLPAKSRVALRTRVGIDRQGFHAAEGALLSTEVRYGQFQFSVMLPHAELKEIVYHAVQWAGSRPDGGGIGRFRSAGWGMFDVKESVLVQPESAPGGGKRYRLRFLTPYVLSEEFRGEKTQEEATKIAVEKQLCAALPEELRASVVVEKIELRLHSLSYIRRWSDEPERQRKENRAVAGLDSELEVSFAQPVTEPQLQLWRWGIGEWFEAGFGSCVITRLE